MRQRQIHLDFHTSPLIPDIGVNYDPEEFAQRLKKAHVNSINLFAKCHHGMYYYPTKLGMMHPGLDFDLLGSQIEACRKEGIRTVVYTCVAWSEQTAKEHPEWLNLNYDGLRGNKTPFESGFYTWNTICINQPAYKEYLKKELAEIWEKHHPDGFWIDIVNSYECVCDECREEMLALGMDPTDREQVRRHDRMSEIKFCREFYTYLKELSPDLEIYFNSHPHQTDTGYDMETSSIEKRKYFSYIDIESLPSEMWGYDHFPIAASYVGKYDWPVTMMNGKFHFSWGDFGSIRSPEALEYECFRAAAYGAGVCIGDQLHPDGHLEPAIYDRIGQVLGKIEEREPWLLNTKRMCDVGVFIAEDNMNPDEPALIEGGAYRVLCELHVPFDFLNSQDDLEGYKVLILPDAVKLSEELAERINDYVSRGGKVLVTGKSSVDEETGKFMLNCIEATYAGVSEDTCRYVRLKDGIFEGIPEIDHVLYERGYTVTSEKEAAASIVHPYFNRTYEHFSSHRQAPPVREESEEPAILINEDSVYISSPLFTDYLLNGYKVHKDILERCIRILYPDLLVDGQLPSATEVLVRRHEDGRMLVHLLNYVIRHTAKKIDTIQDVYHMPATEICVRTEKKPLRVRLVPEDVELEYTYCDSYTHINMPQQSGYTIAEISF